MRNAPRHYPARLDLIQPPYRERPTTAPELTELPKPNRRYDAFIESVFAEHRAIRERARCS